MPPRIGSRYTRCLAVRDEDGRLYLTDREPFSFRELPDTRIHSVVEGDTLWHLAGHYFAPLPRACGFWWVVADFQPKPRLDPTVGLLPGEVLYIPSLRVLTDEIGGGS
jgi:hypothetical protein